MKVAFFVGRFPILSEVFILNQIVGVIERGHEVHIHTFDGPPSNLDRVHPAVRQYDLLTRTYYPCIIPKNHFLRVIKALWLLVINLPKCSWKCIPLLNIFKPIYSLRLLYKGMALLDQGSYDIIHCQFGTLGRVGLRFRNCGLFKGKLISTFRGNDISRHVQKEGEQIYNQLFEQGDFFLANCDFFKHRAIKLGCDENKIAVHGSGIDCNRFEFKPRFFPDDGQINIATVGRLVEKKGIEYAIRAVAKLVKSYHNIEYNIIGDGELKEHFAALIKELGVSHAVKLLGGKEQQELIKILDNSHIFIAPSVTAADGNQDAPVNTLKEAMAMGLPVISTLHGGIPELVEDGISGFLVPERDVDGIVEKLSYLIENPESWSVMGRAGRQRVEEKYDMNKLNDELIQIYKQVCD